MRLHASSLRFLPFLLPLLLAGCSQEVPPDVVIRPAMVIQPAPASDSTRVYPGEVRARYEPDLAFRIGGKVSKRLVDTGSRVKKNQPLAELDPQDVKLQLEAARAQVAAAEANHQLAKGELERYKTLLQKQTISRSQFDAVENQYRASEAQLQQIRAQYDVASNQAGYAVLRAPEAGVIARRLVEVGQVVAAGQTVFTLAVNGEREVVIGVPEQAIDRFSIGQEVQVELWSQSGKLLPGRIRELSPAADSLSRTFATRVAFETSDVAAEVGQSARVYIRSSAETELALPLSAITADDEQSYVWVVNPEDSTVVRTPVRVGSYSQQQVSIVEGLKLQDWVVAAGVHLLQPGQKIRPVNRDNRSVTLVAGE